MSVQLFTSQSIGSGLPVQGTVMYVSDVTVETYIHGGRSLEEDAPATTEASVKMGRRRCFIVEINALGTCAR